ncbi:MAG: hypothetical protein KatS3mg057_1181 [Herpetosiphonaceae bacterium]|nr:MAG: hypothetical protein KatS3mg057_1181 [Herpetosiphonaceae bacterium]
MPEIVFILAGPNESLRALPALLSPDLEVRMLETPNEALWELQRLQPQLIVADVELAGMSGLELAELVPNFAPEARVILCARSPEPGLRQQAEKLGLQTFLEGHQESPTIASAILSALGKDTRSSEPEPGSGNASPALVPDAAHQPSEPAARPARRGTGPLVLTEQMLTPIRTRLQTLAGDLGAQMIVLSDSMGAAMVQVGQTDLSLMALLPLLVTGFSTSAELTRLLHEEESATLYFHEGSRYDVYAFDVGHRFVLILFFEKLVGASKIGPVWVYTKRAIRDLLSILE